MFINKGQLHRASDAEQKDSAYICLDFHSHLISGFEGGLIDRDYVAPYINNAAIPYVVLTETADWQKRVMTLPAVSLPSLLIVRRAFPAKVLVFVYCAVAAIGIISGIVAPFVL